MDGLERAFNPRTVVVVGDKKGQGFFWLKSLKSFQGKVFSVQIDPNEIPHIEELGYTNYTSLLDIPGEVDYVIVSVPRAAALPVVRDCIRKGVGGVTLFTSAFAETGTEDGRRMQEELTRTARDAGLTLIGPNCMGIFHPKIGLRFSVDQYYGEGGRVGFISQSGTHVGHMAVVGALHGVRLSKGVSFGNAVVLDSPDYLEHLYRDKETDIIGMYLEGVKDGRRLFNLLREVVLHKPVVVWKGGETEDGRRAVLSHTASLTRSPQVWAAALRQVGAIPARNLEEMVDTLKGLLYLKPPSGDRMGIVALSGGQSVVVSDAFARAGLRVLPLSPASYQELESFFSVVGASYRNPFDVSWQLPLENLSRILDILERDPSIDNIAVEISGPFLARRWESQPEFISELLSMLVEFREKWAKPLLVMLTPVQQEAIAMEARAEFNRAGLPSYSSFDRAACSLKRVVDYYRFVREAKA
ncbi:MAG: CoA-binding protein [Dehalococcoidia bacterium]